MFPIIVFQKNSITAVLTMRVITWDTGVNSYMRLYVIVSIFLTLEHAYNTDILTHQYTGNNSECLIDELYGDFTVEEYNKLVKRRNNVRNILNNNLDNNFLRSLHSPSNNKHHRNLRRCRRRFLRHSPSPARARPQRRPRSARIVSRVTVQFCPGFGFPCLASRESDHGSVPFRFVCFQAAK